MIKVQQIINYKATNRIREIRLNTAIKHCLSELTNVPNVYQAIDNLTRQSPPVWI